MKKITFLTLILATSLGFAQIKSSGNVVLQPNMTANFSLDNATSKATLILTGPSDRWFGIGIGVSSGFGMGDGDVLVYTTALTDRKFVGTGTPSIDSSADWTVVSNTISGTIRTLNLTRNLTNSDVNGSDFQMPYATTTSFSIVGVRASSATTSIGSHGGSASAGYATANFTVLGVEDFSLNATSVYPNPSIGSFNVSTKTTLDQINIYSQTGQFIKTIDVQDKSNKVNITVNDLATGIYLIELKNETDKTWKKIIIE